MKTIFRTLVAVFTLLILSQGSVIAAKKKEVKEIKIKTTAVCGMCEDRLEHNMKFEKGVTAVDLDLPSQVMTISYRTNKTNPDKLRKAISKIGYDADTIPADPKAYEKLPACCKKDVEPH